MPSISERIHELKNPTPKPRDISDAEVLSWLPGDLPAPWIVSNGNREPAPQQPSAWLSYKAWSRYATSDERMCDPAEVLAAFLAQGFAPLPTIAAKWDRYRVSPHPAAADDAVYTSCGRPCELTASRDILPLWYREQGLIGLGSSAHLYVHLRSPENRLFRLSFEVAPRHTPRARFAPARVGMDAYYEHGSAQLVVPDAWRALHDEDGDTYATPSTFSGAWLGPSPARSVDSLIFWEPITGEWPPWTSSPAISSPDPHPHPFPQPGPGAFPHTPHMEHRTMPHTEPYPVLAGRVILTERGPVSVRPITDLEDENPIGPQSTSPTGADTLARQFAQLPAMRWALGEALDYWKASIDADTRGLVDQSEIDSYEKACDILADSMRG